VLATASDLARAGSRSLPEVLSDGAMLAAVPEALCGVAPIFCWGMAELRFLEGAPHVDLGVCIAEQTGGRAATAAWLAAGGTATWPEEWSGFGALLKQWARRTPGPVDALPYLWVEVDAAGGTAPYVYVSTEDIDADIAVDAAVQACRLLRPEAATPPTEALLRRAVAALPRTGRLMHVAPIRLDRGDGVRLVVAVPIQEMTTFLVGSGWSGDIVRASAIAADIGRHGSHVGLQLDLTDVVGPRLGVEVSYPCPGRIDPRWTQALRRLTDLGLASPRRAAAVLTWSAGSGAGGRRRAMQVKVSVTGSVVSDAKAYLGF
jgi:hypothetical protein